MEHFQQGEFQSTGGENIVLIGVSSVILFSTTISVVQKQPVVWPSIVNMWKSLAYSLINREQKHRVLSVHSGVCSMAKDTSQRKSISI